MSTNVHNSNPMQENYTEKTRGITLVMEAASPLILACLNELKPFLQKLSENEGNSEIFTIADFGSADGGTSMDMWAESIRRIRSEFGDSFPIEIRYEDQPVNDFRLLFMRLHGLNTETPNPLLADPKLFPNVYCSATGTSFYRQCFPPESVSLGFSSTAMHWLSAPPCPFESAIHHSQVGARLKEDTSLDPDTRKRMVSTLSQWVDQARKDWEAILLNRSREMMSGGRLVIVNFAIDSSGQHLGHTNDVPVSLYDMFDEQWKSMVRDGRITHLEYVNTNFPQYYRTEAELRAPFTTAGFGTSLVMNSGLRLESLDMRTVPCVYRSEFHESPTPGFAQRYSPTLSSWSDGVFMSGLSDTRSNDEKRSIVNEFWKRIEDEISKSPGEHGLDYVHAYGLSKAIVPLKYALKDKVDVCNRNIIFY
eukprot:545135_1